MTITNKLTTKEIVNRINNSILEGNKDNFILLDTDIETNIINDLVNNYGYFFNASNNSLSWN